MNKHRMNQGSEKCKFCFLDIGACVAFHKTGASLQKHNGTRSETGGTLSDQSKQRQ